MHFSGQCQDLGICATKVGHSGRQGCDFLQTNLQTFCLVYRLKDSWAPFWLLIFLSKHGTKRIAGRTRQNVLNTWPHAFLRAVSRSWDLCDEGRAFWTARVRFFANKSPKVLLSIPPQGQLGAILAAGQAEQTWQQKNCRPHTTKCPERVATCISQGSVKILGSVRRRSGILDGKGAIFCQTNLQRFCLVYRLKDSRATFWLLVWLSRHDTKRIAGRTRQNVLNTWPQGSVKILRSARRRSGILASKTAKFLLTGKHIS